MRQVKDEACTRQLAQLVHPGGIPDPIRRTFRVSWLGRVARRDANPSQAPRNAVREARKPALRVAFPALPGRRERLTMYPHRRRVRSYRESGKSDRMGSGIPLGCTRSRSISSLSSARCSPRTTSVPSPSLRIVSSASKSITKRPRDRFSGSSLAAARQTPFETPCSRRHAGQGSMTKYVTEFPDWST